MGMFTTIIHEGKEYQFKHGWDDCDTYQVGDKIEWTPDPRYPGIHIDGVYDSIVCDHDYSQGPWVIIKDCVIVAVEPFVGPDYQYLVQKYGITKPDHKLWSKEAWKAKHKREKEAEERYEEWKKVHGDDPVSYWTYCMVAACRFLGREEMEKMGCIDGDHKDQK